MSQLVRPWEVDIRGQKHLLHIPLDPAQHMDEDWKKHGEEERFFPFWMEPWPSSFALYDYLQQRQIHFDFAVEIGCGCGVFAQLAKSFTGSILHTDLVPTACAFASQQVQNPQRHFACMDMANPIWITPPDLLFAADIFYEYPLIDLFANLLKSINCIALVADPGRPSRPLVPERIRQTGFVLEEIPWSYIWNQQEKHSTIWKLGKR